MAFTLDTSGEVEVPVETNIPSMMGCVIPVRWSDLSPFEQGYVEAMFAAWVASFPVPQERGVQRVQLHRIGFSDLAPETLAAIRKDCAAALRPGLARLDTKDSGENFWKLRQRGIYADRKWRQFWPPLTVTLGDDGKVRFA